MSETDIETTASDLENTEIGVSDMEELSDDDLESVSGGWTGDPSGGP